MTSTRHDTSANPTGPDGDIDDAVLADAKSKVIHSEDKRPPNGVRASQQPGSANESHEAARSYQIGSEDSAGVHSNSSPDEDLSEPVNINKPPPWSRDWTQSVLAGMIVLTVPLTVVLAWGTLIHGVPASEVKDISLVLFGPLAGLAGAVVGYYYGKEVQPAHKGRSK